MNEGQTFLSLPMQKPVSPHTNHGRTKGVCQVRSVFSKRLTLTKLMFLTAVLFTLFFTRSGFTSNGAKEIAQLDEEASSLPPQSGGGTAYFTNGVYDSRDTWYKYIVDNAPPNVCGELHIIRNYNSEVTLNWICTNSIGHAENGPWRGSKDQTGQAIYILWPNGTRTTGGDYKVDDGSNPSINANQNAGVGVPIPTSFNGTASDVPYGTGFNVNDPNWSYLRGTFRQIKSDGTSRYYNGSGYVSTSAVNIPGTASPPVGYSFNWSITPPPSYLHNSTDTYEWCVYTKDKFYPAFSCIYFYGPR